MESEKLTECAYCNKVVPDEGEYVPGVEDDEEWERLAELHGPYCEWVETRGHRVIVEG